MGKRAQEELELQECAEGGGAVQTPPCSLEPFRRARWWTGGCQGVWSPHCVNSECLPGRGVPRFAPRPPCPHSLLECGSRKGAGQGIPISLATFTLVSLANPGLLTCTQGPLLALKCLITPTSHPPIPTERWPLPPSRVLGLSLCMPEVAPNLQPKHLCV